MMEFESAQDMIEDVSECQMQYEEHVAAAGSSARSSGSPVSFSEWWKSNAVDGKVQIPCVLFACGAQEMIIPRRFWVRLGPRTLATRDQIPLSLAFAATIDSTLGFEFDRAELDLQNVRGDGRVYTALSRVRSLEGLQLVRPFVSANVSCCAVAARFVTQVQEQQAAVMLLLKEVVDRAVEREEKRRHEEEEKRRQEVEEQARERQQREEIQRLVRQQQEQDRAMLERRRRERQQQPQQHAEPRTEQAAVVVAPPVSGPVSVPVTGELDRCPTCHHYAPHHARYCPVPTAALTARTQEPDSCARKRQKVEDDCTCGRPEKRQQDGRHRCRWFGRFVCSHHNGLIIRGRWPWAGECLGFACALGSARSATDGLKKAQTNLHSTKFRF